MKKNLLKSLIIIASLLFSLNISAYDFYEGGFYFNYVDKNAKTVELTNSASETSYGINTYRGDVEIPETIEHLGVTYTIVGIGKSAFDQCTNLTNVKIPNSIKYLGDIAFAWCKCYFTFNIPEELDSIGSDCFYQCYSSQHITLPKTLKKMGTGMFSESQITSVVYSEGLEQTGDRAFFNDISLQSYYPKQ